MGVEVSEFSLVLVFQKKPGMTAGFSTQVLFLCFLGFYPNSTPQSLAFPGATMAILPCEYVGYK